MKKMECKIGLQVTHVVNDSKQGVITGILKPDTNGIRVAWENLSESWHSPSQLTPRPPKTSNLGFNAR